MASELGDTDDRHDELADAHGDGTPDEQATASELLNHVERGGGGDHVDDVHNGGHEERVLDADLLEERSAIVD